MDVSIRKMYNYLLSQTFPGLLLTLQIILGLQWFAKFDALSLLRNLLSQEGGVIIAVLLITYAVSTLLGTIVDGIHHCLFDDIYVKIRCKYKKLRNLPNDSHAVCDSDKKFYDCFPNNMAYNVYQDRILDDYYYYSEAYANTAIIMVPGTFFLYHWLCNISNMKLCSFEAMFPLIVYISVIIMMAYQAITTHAEYEKEENAFIASFSDRTQKGANNG